MTSPGWSTRQLAEFLEAISAVDDVATARRAAVERAAEALEAEVAAVIGQRGVETAIGFDSGQVSEAALTAVKEGHSKTIDIPGVGRCAALSVAIGGQLDASLVIARTGQEPFTSEQLNVARGLANALAMAERMMHGREEERELRRQSENEARERQAAEANYRSLVERLPAIVYMAESGENGRWTYVSPQIEELLGFTPEQWTSDPGLWIKQVHPEDRERALDQEGDRVLGERDPPPIDYRLLTRDGREIWVLDEAVLESDDEGKAVWHGVLYDISERKQAEGELERRAAQQAAVASLGERALKGAELQELMEEAAQFVVDSTGACASCVWEYEGEERSLGLRGCAGLETQADAPPLPVGRQSPAGMALVAGQPVTVDDWESDDRFEIPPHLRELGVRSSIAAPIEGESQPRGVIEAHSDQPYAFTSQDHYFVQSAVNVLAHAVERYVVGEALRYGALHDQVTGLPNRTLFVDRLNHALGVAKGRETPLGVFFLDLDHFKVINDSLGHEVGDEVLTAVVPRLRKQLRSADTVARFGGDEFAILVDEVVDESEARRIAERLCAAFQDPFLADGLEQHLSASIGISISGGDGADAESLIRDAHAAMYRAKDQGRNRAELFDQEMRSRTVRRLHLERELRRALDREELSLHYQPIVALASGEIFALEALLRWEHRERGMIGPAEFIPVAEESGLIHPIGRWVIERACQQSLAWQMLRPDARPIDVTVNLSARQFAERDLPDVVAAILSRTGLDPVHLKFEITESVLMEQSGTADEMLRELNALGVQLILDDFGTGYSSLAYINRFPLDAIKVDRSFVEGLGIAPERAALVEAITGMASALQLRAIAEGVENEVQLAELRRLRCGYAQGFLFSRPLPVREMTALLERAASGPAFEIASSRGSFRAETPR